MKYITFNPTWNVPPSIIRNEYLPALERDPNALTHTVANKPVMTHVRRPVIADVLPAARKPKLPSEPFGWEARWDANYFRSRRSAYELFGGFSSW